jgi:hypothetical protein
MTEALASLNLKAVVKRFSYTSVLCRETVAVHRSEIRSYTRKSLNLTARYVLPKPLFKAFCPAHYKPLNPAQRLLASKPLDLAQQRPALGPLGINPNKQAGSELLSVF